MYHALIWLLAVEVLGLVALPLTFTLFRRLPDRGIAFSKILAILLVSYAYWVLGLTRLFPNSQALLIGIVVVLAAVSALMVRRRLPQIVEFVRRERVYLITAEAVFLTFFFLWLGITSFSPEINHTEKPMDFAFLNAVLASSYFPPEDPWLSGHSVSYYYFGHLMMAALTKLTAIPSSVSYNLSIALIPALLATGVFSLLYSLIRLSGAHIRTAALYALAGPVLLLLIGNLEGAFEFVHAQGWGSAGFWDWLAIKDLNGPQSGDASIFPRQWLWWWHSTRLIDTVEGGISLDYTITEFPFFSFLLGDLHAHVSALPVVVLGLALGLNLFVAPDAIGLRWVVRHGWEALAIALALGALAFINIWDFPIFATVFAGLVLVKAYGDAPHRARWAVLSSLGLLLPVLAGAVLLYLPFYLTFGSQASGVAAAGDELTTRPFYFLLIWGLFLVMAGAFFLRQLARAPRLWVIRSGAISLVVTIAFLPFLVWAGWQLMVLWTGWDYLVERVGGDAIGGAGTVGFRIAKLLPALTISAVALYTMLLRARHGGERATPFVLLPLAVALYLLSGAELFYLLDFFGNRMNTVFKVYYQAWLLLAIVSAYGLYYCLSRPFPASSLMPTGIGARFEGPLRVALKAVRAPVKYGWVVTVGILFLVSLYYPVGAALNRANNSGESNSLDGLSFLSGGRAGEYEAIVWLRNDAPRGRIVEAVGGDYSEFGRISASTGLPTVLGWKGHEHQWRGSTKLFEGREEDVALIYESDNPVQVRDLLDAYDVRYVYLGDRERRKYGGQHLRGFTSLLQPVFTTGDVVIFERI